MQKKTTGFKSAYHTWLGFQHYLRSWRSPFIRLAPPGHYLSPLPSAEEIHRRAGTLFDQSIQTLPGIDLNLEKQITVLETFATFAGDFPYAKNKNLELRYTPYNAYFPIADALILYSHLRHYHPHQVIEIGSGYSSAVILDTNDHFLHSNIALTFIEPSPQRLHDLLHPSDHQRSTIIDQPVQNIPLETFQALKANDILFIDSSHIIKIGSDVAFLIFDVLPTLNPGVLIHFHDVFWPFEYPLAWYEQGYCCNEDHFLHSFLQFNATFSINFFTSYLQIHQSTAINKYLPLLAGNSGCSLWLVKSA